MFVVIKNDDIIFVAKNYQDAEKAFISNKYYAIPFFAGIKRFPSVIYQSELYSVLLRPQTNINYEFLGKIIPLNEFIKILPTMIQLNANIYEFTNCYGDRIIINDVTPEYINSIIERVKKDLETLKKYKNQPRIYRISHSPWRVTFLRFIINNGQRIRDDVYYYQSHKYMHVVNIRNNLTITIPNKYPLNEFEKAISQEIAQLDKRTLQLLKQTLPAMFDIPQLQLHATIMSMRVV
jgi:hypothetical protein